jgi:acyl-CoA synthetase (AMP-forming)/AMP-acid ligase II
VVIYRSPYAPIAIPEISLPHLLLASVAGREEKAAVIDGATGRTLSYGQWGVQVRRVAAGLAQRGLHKGDVFAILLPNCLEYTVILPAVMLVGGICTTINPTYTAREIAYQIEQTNAAYLLTTPDLLGRARDADRDGRLRDIFVVGEATDATSFDKLLVDSGEPPDVAIDPRRDLAALPFSSGTTGLAKGVMISHYNLVANLLQYAAADPSLDDRARLVAALPIYHAHGQVAIVYLALHLGGTAVLMARFDLQAFLTIIQDYRITRASIVPPIVVALARSPLLDQFDLSSLEVVTSAAAPLSAEIARTCAARLGYTLLQGYGMTETTVSTHRVPRSDDAIEIGTVGVCLPLTEARIVDPVSGEDVGPRERGEIWVRGPQIMRGYLHNPDATATMLDGDGWLRTGDIGYVDERGYLYIVDRLKELIKYKGRQVAPAELEAILITHPAVADAAVIPSPDPEAGEVPKAFVVLKGEATAAELQAFVAERVAPFKKIRRLEFCQSLPRSASGKILRRVLVEQERAH